MFYLTIVNKHDVTVAHGWQYRSNGITTIDKLKALMRDCIYNFENTDLEIGVSITIIFGNMDIQVRLANFTLVNVHVDLLVFTRITS